MERISGSLQGLLKSPTVVAGTAPSCHKPRECFFVFVLFIRKKKDWVIYFVSVANIKQGQEAKPTHTNTHLV